MSKNRYQINGEYTISFDVEVLAESEEEAIEMAEDIYFWESANNGIFADPIENEYEVSLNADGMVDNVVAECLEENVETDDDDDDDDWDDEEEEEDEDDED